LAAVWLRAPRQSIFACVIQADQHHMSNSKDKLSISTLLYRHSPRLLVFSVLLGVVAGGLYSLIIPFVLSELDGDNGKTGKIGMVGMMATLSGNHQMALFFLLCLFILVTKVVSVIMVNNIAKSATAELRLNISRKINLMRIDQVEGVGFSKLLNILIEDVNNVANAAVAIPMVLVSTVTVIGMLGYLATLNFTIFLVVFFAIIIGVMMFQVPVSMASGLYTRARVLRDVIQEGIRGLVLGAYELKLARKKSLAFIESELVVPQQESVRLQKIGDAVLHLAGTSSDLLSFFIIGIIVFVLPNYMTFPKGESYGVVMALLYLAGPVASILGMMQQLQVGQVSIERIHELNSKDEEQFDFCAAPRLGPWQEYRVENVRYQYPLQDDNQERSFALDPVSLSFKPAQINFIVGGNGSGKSTLSKLLSLHYRSTGGGIFFDQHRIDDSNIEQARSRIAVIFSNYYLFSKLYVNYTDADVAKINHYLDALGLRGKTEFVDGRFTTTKLSDGQRRRLALLVALLENRDIYVFDEWAADQDPEFKRVFYQEILQDMKKDNKLIIVITHDDRYFDCADRVIFMEDGKMIGEKTIALVNEAPANKVLQHSFLPDA
jgi:putative ATP-binding cassette transporter